MLSGVPSAETGSRWWEPGAGRGGVGVSGGQSLSLARWKVLEMGGGDGGPVGVCLMPLQMMKMVNCMFYIFYHNEK